MGHELVERWVPAGVPGSLKKTNMAYVEFGHLAKPLSDQVKTGNDLELADKAAESITLLHIHGFLTDAEAHRARERLLKRL